MAIQESNELIGAKDGGKDNKADFKQVGSIEEHWSWSSGGEEKE